MGSVIPSIPGTEPLPGQPDWLRQWLDATRQWARARDPRETTVGSPVDKFMTRAELLELGLLLRRADGSFAPGSGGTTIIVPGGGGGGGGGGTPPDLTPAPTPTGLTVDAAISNLIIQWAAPTYTQGGGHGRTNIYGAVWATGAPEPFFVDAKLIDTAMGAATIKTYATNPGTRWKIWIKWQTLAGVESLAPAGGIHGVEATTGQDVSALLGVLSGAITETQLFAALNARLNLIDAPSTGLVTRVADLQTVYGTTASAAASAAAAAAAEAAAILAKNSAETAASTATTQAGVAASQASAAGFSASAASSSASLAAASAGSAGTSAIAAESSRLTALTAAGDALAYRNDAATSASSAAGSASTATTQAGVAVSASSAASGSAAAAVVSANSAAASASDAAGFAAASAVDYSAVQARLNNFGGSGVTVETTVSATASTVSGLTGQYMVRMSVDGYMSGFGLQSDLLAGGTPTSTFIVSVDKFAVATPESSVPLWAASASVALNAIRRISGVNDKVLVCRTAGTTGGSAPSIAGAIGSMVVDNDVRWQIASRVPFSVLTVPTLINGATVAAGVYIDAAYVLNGTVQNAQLGNAAVDDVKIANMAVGKLTAGSLQVGAYIQSTSYVAGSAGWRISADGSAEFSGVIVRGTIFASAGTIGGITIGATAIQSSNYVPATSGFRLHSDGSLDVGNGSFRGSVTALSGAIGGVVIGADHIRSANFDGTFNGSGGITSGGTQGWALANGGKLVIDAALVRGQKTASATSALNLHGSTPVSEVSATAGMVTLVSEGFVATAGMNGWLDLYVTSEGDRAEVVTQITAVRQGDGAERFGPETSQYVHLTGGKFWADTSTYRHRVAVALTWCFTGGYYQSRTRPPGQTGIPLSPIFVSGALDAGTWLIRLQVRVFVHNPATESPSAVLRDLRAEVGAYCFEHKGCLTSTGATTGGGIIF